jgi:hypothetical protein
VVVGRATFIAGPEPALASSNMGKRQDGPRFIDAFENGEGVNTAWRFVIGSLLKQQSARTVLRDRSGATLTQRP